MQLNETHDPTLRSWVPGADDADSDFPLQNLPYGTFRHTDAEPWRAGVAIGRHILDLGRLAASAPFDGLAGQALAACAAAEHDGRLNGLMALGADHWHALRLALSRALRADAGQSAGRPLLEAALRPMAGARHATPARIGDYTDFYISLHHATAVGRQFRPEQPLLPNYKWVPIGYHGRASSLGVLPAFHRPVGQTRPPREDAPPVFGPSQRLDYELEMAIYIGQGNPQGRRIPIEDAENHVFGLGLLNDWSARDIQAWEYQPLGPFLGKSFASTISPWIVTLEALAPFRAPLHRPAGDPAPLPYLASDRNAAAGAFDVRLQVDLSTEQSRRAGHPAATLSRSNFRDAYWTVAQLVAHHTVNGCNLQAGDLLGTGTLSGPRPEEAGSLLELAEGGKSPLALPWGETRAFLQDGDEVRLSAHCVAPDRRRIGFGSACGRVLPADWA
ncbi:fumarylacetoacetase [Achromobacter aloeverae]|uniref:fumarylacetoacetase n=1 Tax=Achromobacter aloeverae TaxID=1750518 RepID=A0A4Q1HLL1_9BURK|nr:fumarylacetoacetase [Achromobacter aloeverae]RXN90535.1 fumarylacetoacetase [Achromobacter aloeverae]